jgi:hypothetical protein
MKGGDLDGLVAHLIGRMRAAKPVVKSTIGWVRRTFGANGFHFGKGQNFSGIAARCYEGESRFVSFGEMRI